MVLVVVVITAEWTKRRLRLWWRISADDAAQQNGRNDDLRPDAIDAPLAQDVGLHIAQEGRAGEADFRRLKGEPGPARQCKHGDQRVSHDAEGGDGDVQATGTGSLVEGFGRKHGEARVVDCAAIPVSR